MSFGLIQFTNRGRALQAKAQTGVRLVFTRIAVGDGQLSGQDISDLTALIHEIKSVTLNKYKTLPGGKAVVGGVLSNQDIVNGFWWRELGLFAMDPDIGEILYCYGNAGELAEYIPSPGGAQILEKQVDIISIIGNAQNVSAEIDQSLIYATIQDVNNLRDELNEHKVNTNNPHGVTAEQIGAETPAGAQAKANAALDAAKNYTDQEIAKVVDDLASHKNDIMPHKFTDGAKTYRWGFRIVNGQPQFIYEEVME